MIVTGIYGFSAVLAARYSAKVWTKTTIGVGVAATAELLTDGCKAVIAHARNNSYCPWLMVNPGKVTFTEHLDGTFGSYPQNTIDSSFWGLFRAVCEFWCWLMAQPLVFILSIFLLVYSGITSFFFVKTSITIKQRLSGAAKEEAPFW